METWAFRFPVRSGGGVCRHAPPHRSQTSADGRQAARSSRPGSRTARTVRGEGCRGGTEKTANGAAALAGDGQAARRQRYGRGKAVDGAAGDGNRRTRNRSRGARRRQSSRRPERQNCCCRCTPKRTQLHRADSTRRKSMQRRWVKAGNWSMPTKLASRFTGSTVPGHQGETATEASYRRHSGVTRGNSRAGPLSAAR